MEQNPAAEASRTLIGLACAVPAYLIWGLSPIYFKTLKSVPAFEILMHRMIWSFVFLVPVILVQGRWGEFARALTQKRILLPLAASTLLVGFNWFLFIWAINSDHVLQTSLGYYINPLVNVLLGAVFLRERLRPLQLAAVILAAAGVLNLLLLYGRLPWVSLGLAFSFGFYALIRKTAPVGSLVGLTVETMLLTIPAVGYLVYLDSVGRGAFLHIGLRIDLLLMAAALVTALPLVLFTRGARRLRLATMGFLQYIAPTGTFLLAVFLWGEPLSSSQLLTFALIWTALAIYSIDSVRTYRMQRAIKAS
ncbi:MAG: EamA family transporter RarD [Desulfobacterales bacterium]|nr:EamA family transporter RarD [Desulfobacterales bacterium]